MGISPDVLNDALQSLAPKYQNLFEVWSPVIRKIVENGNIERNRLMGPYKEFRVITDGPGDVTTINDGGEVYPHTRKDITAKGNTYASRMVYSFMVPGKDMAEATGPAGVEHLLKQYPEAGLMDFHQRVATQIMNGNGSGVGGFTTFNGATTYDPTGDGTGRDGAFEFAAPAAQTGTAFGLSKATTTGWYNQYADISSMASDGIRKMRETYFKANRRGKLLGPVDIILADETTYSNYIDLLEDRIVVEDSVKGAAGAEDVEQGIRFLKATMYIEDFLDVSASQYSGTAAADGVMYGLKSNTWHMYTLGQDDQAETKGEFSIRGPIRLPNQDAFAWEYVLHMGMYCDFLSANFAVTGGAIP